MATIDLETPEGRLQWAREQAGYDNAAAFAKVVGVKSVTYRAYESGQNGYARYAPSFARKLGVPVEWLLEGGRPPDIIGNADYDHGDEARANALFPAILKALAPFAAEVPATRAGVEALHGSLSDIVQFLERNPAIADDPALLKGAVAAIADKLLSPAAPPQSS